MYGKRALDLLGKSCYIWNRKEKTIIIGIKNEKED